MVNNTESLTEIVPPRKLNTFLGHVGKIEFGDYLLFQEYTQLEHDGEQYNYCIDKPILVIYLGCFSADQTLGFNYVKWNNDRHIERNSTGYISNKQVEDIGCHIEWSDYIDIVGHWKVKPKYGQILSAYRKQNTKEKVRSDEIDWHKM